MYLFHAKRRDDLQFSQHFCTGFQEGGRKGGRTLLPSAARMSRLFSCVEFLNVLYKNYSKRVCAVAQIFVEIRERAFLLLW